MESFFIDKLGNDCDDEENNTKIRKPIESSDVSVPQKIDLFEDLLDEIKCNERKSSCKDLFSLHNTYLITNYKSLRNEGSGLSNVEKIIGKSVIQPGLEKKYSVPVEKSKKALKMQRKKFKEKTKGEKWFDIPATELTEEIKTDFELLKMRSVLDRKHLYKKNDITKIPKYFQVGRIIESPADFYSGRIPKSQRKKTMVEELLADAEFKKYQKKKFKEIMDDNRRRKKNNKNTLHNKKQKKGKS